MTFSPAKFFDSCRAGIMGPTLDNDEVSGASAILAAMDGAPLSWTADALGTAWLETANTLHPIKEFGGSNYFFRMYDKAGQRPKVAAALGNTQPGDGALYCGRGYVQLTGRRNYTLAQAKTGARLVDNPDLAMRPDVAAKIMRFGMSQGWFTGKQFADYLPAGRPASRDEFKAARRIINGQDRANDIAGYALAFQAALQAGEWA
jgi:hypothetical protein